MTTQLNDLQIRAVPLSVEAPDGARGTRKSGADGAVMVSDMDTRALLHGILAQLRILNTHMALITGHDLSAGDTDA